ncbi:hypothetical protein M0R04_03430 [Candidatus Dojkabacteria bacterium]|nr:hypothetical protein [Candidatus Dojkabacteria bacterium]
MNIYNELLSIISEKEGKKFEIREDTSIGYTVSAFELLNRLYKNTPDLIKSSDEKTLKEINLWVDHRRGCDVGLEILFPNHLRATDHYLANISVNQAGELSHFSIQNEVADFRKLQNELNCKGSGLRNWIQGGKPNGHTITEFKRQWIEGSEGGGVRETLERKVIVDGSEDAVTNLNTDLISGARIRLDDLILSLIYAEAINPEKPDPFSDMKLLSSTDVLFPD